MVTYLSLDNLKEQLIAKAKTRLEFNSDYSADSDLVAYFLDEAINEITKWRSLLDSAEFLTGIYDNNIIRYIVESYNLQGNEGQSYNSANGSARRYIANPLANLLGSINQKA
jgi:uncharacterized membrane-anchored protein